MEIGVLGYILHFWTKNWGSQNRHILSLISAAVPCSSSSHCVLAQQHQVNLLREGPDLLRLEWGQWAQWVYFASLIEQPDWRISGCEWCQVCGWGEPVPRSEISKTSKSQKQAKQTRNHDGCFLALWPFIHFHPLPLPFPVISGYVATFHDVGLSGDDGLIVDEARCQIFLGSAGLVLNLAQNLQLLETWGDPSSPWRSGFKWFDLQGPNGPNHGAWEKPMKVKQVGDGGWEQVLKCRSYIDIQHDIYIYA